MSIALMGAHLAEKTEKKDSKNLLSNTCRGSYKTNEAVDALVA